MPLDRGGIKPGVRLQSHHISDVYDLLLGVMTDTDVTFGRNLTVKGALSTVGSISQVAPGPTSVPLTIYGAPGQSVDLLDVRASDSTLLYSINFGGTVINPRMSGAVINQLGPGVSGSGNLVGATAPTLTNAILNNPTINSGVLGGTLVGGTINASTLTNPTINTPTISGGTINSPTLTGTITGVPIVANTVAYSSRDADGVTGRGMVWRDAANALVLQAGLANVTRFVNGANSVQWAHFDANGNFVQDVGNAQLGLGSTAGGDTLVGGTAAQTLSNKTLTNPAINGGTMTNTTLAGTSLNTTGAALTTPTITSPTLAGTVSGTPAWASAQAFPSGSSLGTLKLLGQQANGTDVKIDYGVSNNFSIASNGSPNQSVSFHTPFTNPPFVMATIFSASGSMSQIVSYNTQVHSVTTSNFQVDFSNASGSSQNMSVSWIAIGN